MTDKQKYAIKLAINTMGIHFDRHCNTAYVNRKTGISVGYGEAIDILSDMLSNSDNHACKCQHNNNPRDNETCCRCDDKQTNADRIRTMTDEELAKFLCKVKSDYQWMEHEFPSEEEYGEWEEWLQSEAE